MAERRVVVEIELPEGVRLEDVLKGLRYRVLKPREELEEILARARSKGALVKDIPPREEVYSERTRY
ncbi:MAG: hypothetical protein GSR84_05255 [Desulfurococcales archaeon]|nr:hypothetical protein [Desulfurococcales archaeon]